MANKETQLNKHNTALIGIRFADNDFGTTICAFLKLFLDIDSRTELANFTKPRVVELFHSLAPGLYWLIQNGYRYNNNSFDPAKYLRIEEKDVFLGDEVLAHLEKYEYWDNGEFHYVNLNQGRVLSA